MRSQEGPQQRGQMCPHKTAALCSHREKVYKAICKNRRRGDNRSLLCLPTDLGRPAWTTVKAAHPSIFLQQPEEPTQPPKSLNPSLHLKAQVSSEPTAAGENHSSTLGAFPSPGSLSLGPSCPLTPAPGGLSVGSPHVALHPQILHATLSFVTAELAPDSYSASKVMANSINCPKSNDIRTSKAQILG